MNLPRAACSEPLVIDSESSVRFRLSVQGITNLWRTKTKDVIPSQLTLVGLPARWFNLTYLFIRGKNIESATKTLVQSKRHNLIPLKVN